MFEEHTTQGWQRWFNRQTLAGFLVGVLVGSGAVWSFGDQPNANAPAASDDTPSAQDDTDVSDADNQADDTAGTGENTLVVSNQPAGASVVLSMVALSQSGWVAVHEVLPGGKLGNILGAQRVDEGKHFRQTVSLLRNTAEDETYRAVLHQDDGDSIFDYEQETPVMVNGEEVGAEFIATSGGQE